MDANDYYEVLGVDREETLQGIHTAYRTLAKQCHPDRAGMKGTEQFQAIQEAYEVLSHPQKRQAYDAGIARRRRARAPSGIAPEPLVPSHHPSPWSHPEPLVRPVASPDDLCAPASSSCMFYDDLHTPFEPSCPFCRTFGPMESDVAHVIMRCLRAFHF